MFLSCFHAQIQPKTRILSWFCGSEALETRVLSCFFDPGRKILVFCRVLGSPAPWQHQNDLQPGEARGGSSYVIVFLWSTDAKHSCFIVSSWSNITKSSYFIVVLRLREAKSSCFIVFSCSNIANNSYFIVVLWSEALKARILSCFCDPGHEMLVFCRVF